MAQQAMSRYQRGENASSWSRVMAGLGMLMAKTLCNLGQPRLARHWWVTAQQAAADSGDTDLVLWTHAEELVHGLYDRRPAPVLLRRANKISAQVSAAPCRGLAQISTAHAQILALDGQADAAIAWLHRSTEVTERVLGSVPDDPRTMARWSEDRLRYTEAWIYAYLGDRDRLDTATEQTLALLPAFHRSRAQVQLLQAYGHVKSGDVSEGVRLAQTVYEAQPAEHRPTMIRSLAEQVLTAVPARHLGNGLVADYRELLGQQPHRSVIV